MLNNEMMHCINECQECYEICTETLFNYCLVKGGEHAQVDHVKSMIDCIEICQTAARFMLRNSRMHGAICSACAQICESCYESCFNMEGEEMKRCAAKCKRCAETCRKMAN